MLLASSVPLLVLASLMALTSSAWTREPPLLFWSLFVPFSALANVFYLGEDTLKSEFWATGRRALFTAVVRASSLGATIPVIFLLAYLPVAAYLAVTAVVFAIGGAVAAMAWYFMGVETGRGTSVGLGIVPNHLFDLIVVSDCVLDIYYIVDKLPIGAGGLRRFSADSPLAWRCVRHCIAGP